VVRTSGGSWDLAGIPRTIGAGAAASNRAERLRLRLRLSRAGRRMLKRSGRRNARVVVSLRSRSEIRVTMRRMRL
jgi:hypothetical protein